MPRRILGIDPGLTRCGLGIVDAHGRQRVEFVHVSVVTSAPGDELQRRLRLLADGIEAVLDEFKPDAIALERVFAQQNLPSVMGVAQISGVILVAAERRGIAAVLHTPSEVKAAVTGYGSAEKKQVGTMVQRILRLDDIPKPADAADALALAICSAWKSPLDALTPARGQTPAQRAVASAGRPADAPTTAQSAWLAAERAAKSRGRRVR
ncbi:crossover junction endodeoxyribonuclease RuvC [Pseudoclavibacter sp. RFBI5]|uniref:crossover junction endodeoxyribonuclease RuvC n=1 Tax=Pseudoclavibacter sp. RFBI5 TaxID=2080578 RepID=UPI000CE92267|nr:crossover junction endodeoxyribonuclease RuvC [Pseudoclavibacter sp. RFBI5]PPG02635.1 crossover junction endodeoxyribonuclease RuvC [Pseudoclavibacter sp. RFBI5]